ncbi:hypothetical protein, partial [Candidatus Binatus sp.]
METAKQKYSSETSKVTYVGIPDFVYGEASALMQDRPLMDVAYCSQRGIGAYRGLLAQREQIIPVFVTEDKSAWRLEELASALYELLSKITT